MNVEMYEETSTLMFDVASSAARQVAVQLADNEDRYRALAAALRVNPPHGVLTVARGSSNHAAAYLAHLVMSRTGQLVTALPLSLLSLQRAPVAAHGLLAIAIAQSGRGLELTESLQTLRTAGASTVALVNDSESPLAFAAQWCLPLHAGPEPDLVPSKSFICSLVAAARLCAHWPWGTHWDLREALHALPDALEEACMQDWSAAIGMLCKARRLIVVGQGAGLAIAQEAAARFRDSCGLQTEALACAEICRCPMAQAEAEAAPDTAVLVLALRGSGQRELIELATALRQHGTPVMLVAPSNVRDRDLTLSTPPHRDLEAITTMQSLYLLLDAVSQARREVRTVHEA